MIEKKIYSSYAFTENEREKENAITEFWMS